MPTSPDASFTQKLQDGGRVPGVVITLRRKTISTSSQRLQQCFRARPIHFHRCRHCRTSENSIGCKPEVELVSQTGSTNNSATETDIDTISVAMPMFWGASFPMMYMPTSPDASFTQKLQDDGRIPEVVITLWRKRYQRDLRGYDIDFRHAVYLLPLSLRSRWCRFPSQSYNYFRWPVSIRYLWISGWMKLRVRLAYTPVKNLLPET